MSTLHLYAVAIMDTDGTGHTHLLRAPSPLAAACTGAVMSLDVAEPETADSNADVYVLDVSTGVHYSGAAAVRVDGLTMTLFSPDDGLDEIVRGVLADTAQGEAAA